MLMTIRRTSVWGYKIPPCSEAKKIKIPCWETRTTTEEEFNRKFSAREGLWRSKGKNHKTITDDRHKRWITRQMEDVVRWGIKINSLEDLLNLERKYGEIILSTRFDDSGEEEIFEIEIYDTYRE